MKETKVYLNTVEDLTKALSEGKTVYDDNIFDKSCTRRHRMINGIVIEEYEEESGNYTYINDLITFNKKHFYIIEKQPLKIEVGKFYKTRDGHKVICAYKSKQKEDDRPYFFSSVDKDELFSTWAAEDGHSDEEGTWKRDIVDYWEE